MRRLAVAGIHVRMLACAAAASLAACGGASHAGSVPQTAQTATATAYTGPLSDATFTITIPPDPKPSSAQRRPRYVSSSTSKIVFTLNTSSALSAGQITSFNTSNLGAMAVVLGSATCPGGGPWTCTLTIKLPPGTDNLTISAQDASSNILSQQIQTFTVTAGGTAAGANHFTTTLDANVATMALNVTSGFCAGTFTVANSGTVPTVGTQSLTFTASYKDGAGNTIPTNAPGRPVLKVNGHTDDNGTLGYSDPGNLNVKVTQSAQTFVLQKTDGTGSASVAVTIAPPNTNSSPNDGLSFTTSPGTTNFTFQTGSAPPASFLAAIEQTGSASGQIDLFTLNTSTNAFTANSPATLSNQGGDVDFPQDMLFDTNGDILIANGGAGSPDFGNFACVPAGAITTGANVATVLTDNMDDPKFIALGSDSSVALGNVPASAGIHLDEFVLSGTYTAAATARDITQTDYPGLGVTGVVALPASAQNPAGSFAAAITDGSTTAANSHIVVKHPDGTKVQIDDANVADPALAFDASVNQIIAADGNRVANVPGKYYLTFFDATSYAKVKQLIIQDTGCYNNGTSPYAGCPRTRPAARGT